MLSCCFLQPEVKFCLKRSSHYVPAQRKGKWGRERVKNTCVKCTVLGLAKVELTQQPIRYCALHSQPEQHWYRTHILAMSSVRTAPRLSVNPQRQWGGDKDKAADPSDHRGTTRCMATHSAMRAGQGEGEHWCPCFLRLSWASLADGN